MSRARGGREGEAPEGMAGGSPRPPEPRPVRSPRRFSEIATWNHATGYRPIMTWMKVEDSGLAQLNPQCVQEPIVAEPSCLCSCSDRDGNCKNAQARLPAEAGQPTCTPPLQTGTSDESCTLAEG